MPLTSPAAAIDVEHTVTCYALSRKPDVDSAGRRQHRITSDAVITLFPHRREDVTPVPGVTKRTVVNYKLYCVTAFWTVCLLYNCMFTV